MSIDNSKEKLAAGTIIEDRYVVERYLGEGAMAKVYLVKDKGNNDQELALKIISGLTEELQDFAKMLILESRLLRLVVHPCVVQVFEAGEYNGYPFYVMEYIDGIPLSELIKKRKISLDSVPEIMAQICSGLHVIHETTIIHCDLVPRNILICEGQKVKITDFGLAHPSHANFDRGDRISGSLPYLAPEIWKGEAPSCATDLYSLGALLFEMISGALPLYRESIENMMHDHLHTHPTPITEYVPDIPLWLDGLIERLLAKKTSSRPASALEVLKTIKKNADVSVELPKS